MPPRRAGLLVTTGRLIVDGWHFAGDVIVNRPVRAVLWRELNKRLRRRVRGWRER